MLKIGLKILHEDVAEQIREIILKGDLALGQKIDEKKLAQSMGVSRTPVRESLRILHSEGLVHLVPRKGAFVSKLSIEEIKDMFEVMAVLEGMCARLAVERMRKMDLKRIESLHRPLETHYLERNHEAYLKSNTVLHAFIQKQAGNKALNDVINGLRRKILLYRHKQLYWADRFDESMREHRAILRAFRKGDPTLAETAMKQHLLRQSSALCQANLESNPKLN